VQIIWRIACVCVCLCSLIASQKIQFLCFSPEKSILDHGSSSLSWTLTFMTWIYKIVSRTCGRYSPWASFCKGIFNLWNMYCIYSRLWVPSWTLRLKHWEMKCLSCIYWLSFVQKESEWAPRYPLIMSSAEKKLS
jgi:hypothetical protein